MLGQKPKTNMPSSVKPGLSGWSLHRPASCIIFCVTWALPFSKHGPSVVGEMMLTLFMISISS